jgi:hypothetical protein
VTGIACGNRRKNGDHAAPRKANGSNSFLRGTRTESI